MLTPLCIPFYQPFHIIFTFNSGQFRFAFRHSWDKASYILHEDLFVFLFFWIIALITFSYIFTLFFKLLTSPRLLREQPQFSAMRIFRWKNRNWCFFPHRTNIRSNCIAFACVLVILYAFFSFFQLYTLTQLDLCLFTGRRQSSTS